MHPLICQSQRSIYQGSVIAVRVDQLEIEPGRCLQLDLVLHPGAAAVVPLTAAGEVVLVRQRRYPTGTSLLEVPAGKRDPGETPETCARRELEEETGLRAARLTPLGPIWTTPGFCNELIWLYLAESLSETAQALDADEVLEVERLPWATAVAQAVDGTLTDAKTICALLRADARLRSRPAAAATTPIP